MTAKEKNIRNEERKLMAKIRRRKRNATKKWESLSPVEFEEYWRKRGEVYKAMGFNVIP